MWIIVRDLLEDGKCVGRCSVDYDEDQAAQLTHRFRMLDSDNIVHYEGRSDDGDSERGFDPLDDFGEGYSGCTSIEYFANSRWQQL